MDYFVVQTIAGWVVAAGFARRELGWGGKAGGKGPFWSDSFRMLGIQASEEKIGPFRNRTDAEKEAARRNSQAA